MVPVVNNTSDLLLRDVYRGLMEQTKPIDADSVDEAFIAWMGLYTPETITDILPADFIVTNYHHIARLAFKMEVGSANQHQEGLLKDGLNRVSGRTITFLETEPAPFRHDTVALLGLALGARRIGGQTQQKVQQWMRSFINPSDKAAAGWKRVFYFAMMYLVGETVDMRDLQDISAHSDIKLAFASKGIDIFGVIDLDEAYQACCRHALSQDTEAVTAACRLSALNYLAAKVPAMSMHKPTVEQVVNLLDRISVGLKRWPWEDKAKTPTSIVQKWDIQNEYHVQSLVYSLLAPIFPDIEDEFYFEPVGSKNPRADIGIPSLQLIIEIKFLRSSSSFGKIIEEIGSDASLYFKKDSVFAPKYSRMIVLLWDNTSRTPQHHEFKKGAIEINNIIGATVISRPGNMVSKAPTEQKKNKPLSKGKKSKD